MRRIFPILSALLLLAGCQSGIRIAGELDSLPETFPDYAGVTVPYNIAPLNFRYTGGEHPSALILTAGDQELTLRGPLFDIPQKQWQALTAAGDITARVCVKEAGGWKSHKPLTIGPDRPLCRLPSHRSRLRDLEQAGPLSTLSGGFHADAHHHQR